MCQHFSDLDPENSLFNSTLLYLLRDYNGDNEYGRRDFLFTRIVTIIMSAICYADYKLYFTVFIFIFFLQYFDRITIKQFNIASIYYFSWY